MGDPRRSKKKYSGPSHPWQKERIELENKLRRKYGLRRKREIWKANSIISKFKNRAKKLVGSHGEQYDIEKQQLLKKVVEYGFVHTTNPSIDDVLSINITDVLDRRLQTLVFEKGLAKTIKQARQMIVHRHIMVGDKRITFPSYIVSVKDEHLIRYTDNSPFNKNDHPEIMKIKGIVEEKPKEEKKEETKQEEKENDEKNKKEEAKEEVKND